MGHGSNTGTSRKNVGTTKGTRITRTIIKINKKKRINSKFNKNNYHKKHAYLVNKNENYQDDFTKDYNSDKGIEIDYVITNNQNNSNLNRINNVQQIRINRQQHHSLGAYRVDKWK